MFVDIHCHILPGIDDGAADVEASLEMARMAVSQGITHLSCTPHHNNGVYMNDKEKIIPLVAELQEILNKHQIPLRLFEGQEVRISGDIQQRMDREELLFCDMSDQYILIEFPFDQVPHYAKKVLFDMCVSGLIPVIVHPERNATWIKDPHALRPFIEMGCLAQVTCSSYLGHFGKNTQKAAETMLACNYAHVLASDAHNTRQRGFYMRDAHELLELDFGKDKKEQFIQTAKDIVNGEKSRVLPLEEPKKKFKLFR